jgi:hypothetical protein
MLPREGVGENSEGVGERINNCNCLLLLYGDF